VITISGVVLTDRLQLQMLKAIPIDINIHESATLMCAARAFGAFRIAFHELITYYNNLSKPRPQRQVTFPYPNSFTDGSGIPTMFKYLDRYDSSKLIFIATTGHHKVFIKFTPQYSEDAHRFCARVGLAPQLYSVTPLPAGWFMVVMEYLDPTVYRTLGPQDSSDGDLVTEVGRVVGVLHDGGFVHGDIRTINMMVHCKWGLSTVVQKLLLVDFDWAGPEGKVESLIDLLKKLSGSKKLLGFRSDKLSRRITSETIVLVGPTGASIRSLVYP